MKALLLVITLSLSQLLFPDSIFAGSGSHLNRHGEKPPGMLTVDIGQLARAGQGGPYGRIRLLDPGEGIDMILPEIGSAASGHRYGYAGTADNALLTVTNHMVLLSMYRNGKYTHCTVDTRSGAIDRFDRSITIRNNKQRCFDIACYGDDALRQHTVAFMSRVCGMYGVTLHMKQTDADKGIHIFSSASVPPGINPGAVSYSSGTALAVEILQSLCSGNSGYIAVRQAGSFLDTRSSADLIYDFEYAEHLCDTRCEQLSVMPSLPAEEIILDNYSNKPFRLINMRRGVNVYSGQFCGKGRHSLPDDLFFDTDRTMLESECPEGMDTVDITDDITGLLDSRCMSYKEMIETGISARNSWMSGNKHIYRLKDRALVRVDNISGILSGELYLVIPDDISSRCSEMLAARLSQTRVFNPAAGDVVLYPNPTEGYFRVISARPVEEIRVINGLGVELLRSAGLLIDLSAQPAGSYFVVIRDDSGSRYYHKIIKI